MTPTFTPADLAALLPPHHVGVPCATCHAPVGARCATWDTPRATAHSAREYRAWYVRGWLFLHGIDCNEAHP